MEWKEKAIKTLQSSLKPVPSELNDLDWKSDLSPKSDKLAQHISAFANQSGGGFLVFGVNDDGTLFSVTQNDANSIVERLGNIAISSLNHPIVIEHAFIEYEGYSLLFVYIPEHKDKPVHIKGGDLFNSYCRSAGLTVKMPQHLVRIQAGISQGVPYELQIAMDHLTPDYVLQALHYQKAFEILGREVPSTKEPILNIMREYHFCGFTSNHWHITNLGALLFANNLRDFSFLGGKSLIIRKFFGTNNLDMDFDRISNLGYAIDFHDSIDFIMKHTHKGEIRDIRRTYDYIYPKDAIREFVANALIHQDFTHPGSQIAVEIFTDRLTITNPGEPLNDVNLLIHLPPKSRNELLANTMYLLNFCEKRGSGINKAYEAIEQKGNPAVKFRKSEVHTQVILFPVKDFREMTKSERINVCYQHACLLFKKNVPITNQSLRDRFHVSKGKSKAISFIISDALEMGLIKPYNENSESRKFASYIPYYG